ncbi:alpha/beta hydrolase [Nocardioides pinisoli]|uniref:Alpha/beta fold hydrolase n=1 Tax=Nocardioides pinisoli TaxID=2950279 RepID=A0ABT1KZ51_9ACTN|nr:alpha/beta fold hydrolase [Nocardioides pinisoli]MCP3423049.1 alpha/beta fold hydrolase [Nocardioides pinisoli]
MGTAARRGVTCLVLVAGLVLLAVGVGTGPRHYAEAGPTAAAAWGFALLAVGLVGSAWAAVVLLRSTRRRWWVVTVPLLLLGTYLSLWTIGQAVAAAYPPRPELDGRTPADVGLAYRDVAFPSSDGVRLEGWYVPSRNGAAVALLHGAGSTRTGVLDEAAVLAGHGYGVLLYDARGHGASSGPGMDFGWYGEQDAAGAVDHLADLPDVSPGHIGLVGLSMGGEEAIGAAGVDDRVAAVVAEGATNRTADDKGYLSAYGARGEVQQWIDDLTYGVTDLLTDAPEPASLRQSVDTATGRGDPTTFLLVAAGGVETETLAADFIAGDSTGVEVWTVPESGHMQGLRTTPEEWERRVVGFLDRALLPDAADGSADQ